MKTDDTSKAFLLGAGAVLAGIALDRGLKVFTVESLRNLLDTFIMHRKNIRAIQAAPLIPPPYGGQEGPGMIDPDMDLTPPPDAGGVIRGPQRAVYARPDEGLNEADEMLYEAMSSHRSVLPDSWEV